VRAYPASALKRLRLVQIPQEQGAGQGQVLYTLASPGGSLGQKVTLKAQSQQLQSTYIQPQPLYRQPTPVPVISPRPLKTVYRAKPPLSPTVLQQQEEEEAQEDEYPADVRKLRENVKTL